MKGKCFNIPEKFRNRMLMMIIGVCVQALGVAMLIRINFGTDPFTTLNLAIIKYIPVSFGTWTLICNIILFVPVILFDMSKIGFGTIGNMVCLGYIADFYGWIIDSTVLSRLFEGMAARSIMLIPAMIVFICGAACYLCADLGSSPYDGLPFIIGAHLPKLQFKYVRMTWDISFTVLGFLIGGTVGVVTIITAFFLGPAIALFQKKLAVFVS